MFFIFGWGGGTTQDLGPTTPVHCANCHNHTDWHLVKQQKWFTLFFLRILPYESRHYLLCPICSHGVMLEGDGIERAKRLNAAVAGQIAGTDAEPDLLALPGPGTAANTAPTPDSPREAPLSTCPDCGFESFNTLATHCPDCQRRLVPGDRFETRR